MPRSRRCRASPLAGLKPYNLGRLSRWASCAAEPLNLSPPTPAARLQSRRSRVVPAKNPESKGRARRPKPLVPGVRCCPNAVLRLVRQRCVQFFFGRGCMPPELCMMRC